MATALPPSDEHLCSTLDILKEMFPYVPETNIQNIVTLVETETPDDSKELQFENIVNMLTGAGNIYDINVDENVSSLTDNLSKVNIVKNPGLDRLFKDLETTFPDACPKFIGDLIADAIDPNLDDLISIIIGTDYPKKKIDPDITAKVLQDMLPNADPDYIMKNAYILSDRPEEELRQFVDNALENKDYPTMQDYLSRKKHESAIAKYTNHFNVAKFLKEFPKPQQYFENPKRKLPLQNIEDAEQRKTDEKYALTFLKNHYNYIRSHNIEKIFKAFNYNLYHVCMKLDRFQREMKNPRKTMQMPETGNVELMQEICYLTHKKDIGKFMKLEDENYQRAKEECRLYNLFQTCGICYEDELLPEEVLFCGKGCSFCKNCIRNGTEVAIAEGKFKFPCYAEKCNGEFNIYTLQMVLNPVTFRRLAQRVQYEEIKNANIDGLETCPKCDFVTIPDPSDKVFKCENPECMEETCRECGHKAHIPLRCNEIEYDEDVKMRVYIENKMTEALLRKCWKCSKVFIKESGCNKMTCSCGALMCYVCGQRVTNYTHFGGGNPCPLYTDNLNLFHGEAVLKGAEQAKNELGIKNDPKKLKFDPTRDLKNHYSDLK